MSFEIEKNIEGSLIHFKVAGKILSTEDVEEMDAALYDVIDNTPSKPLIILDLEDLSHTNSTGLNHFIRYFTKSRNKGGELVMINIGSGIKKLFEITKLIEVFTIAESKEKAVALLNDL